MVRRLHKVILLTACLAFLGGTFLGPSSAQARFFEQGSVRASLGLGMGAWGEERYFILGPGLGYFVLDGLALELDTQIWFIGDPSIFVLSPGVRYTVTQLGDFKPYLGGFYKHSFIKGYDDTDGVGMRVGVSWSLSKNLLASGGMVFEHLLDCEGSSCNRFRPELGISLAF